jgi:WD40 repeat protein
VWCPAGRYLAWAPANQPAIVWDLKDEPQLKLQIPLDRANSISWNPEGDKLVVASVHSTRADIWSILKGSKIHSLYDPETIYSAAWSPDGRQIATARFTGGITIWDADDFHELRQLPGHEALVAALEWSPDGTRLASAGFDTFVKVWDPTSGKELKSLVGHAAYVRQLAWSRDGKRLASSSVDGTVRIWDPESGSEVMLLCQQRGNACVAWSHDGTRLPTTAEDGLCRIWDARIGYQHAKESEVNHSSAGQRQNKRRPGLGDRGSGASDANARNLDRAKTSARCAALNSTPITRVE